MNVFNLNGVWNLQHQPVDCNTAVGDYPDILEAMVPGDVHLTLMKHGIIKDPLIRDNFRECRQIGELEWIYTKRFNGNFPDHQRHVLCFDGLTYLASVFLNGRCIGKHKNMHRPLRIDISNIVRDKDENLLEVKLQAFDPATLNTPIIKLWANWSDAITNQDYCVKRGASRKAEYTYGWDWTQGLPICGIWRDVFIESIADVKIDTICIRTKNDGSISCSFNVDSILREMVCVKCTLTVRRKGEKEVLAQTCSDINIGPGLISYEMNTQIASPKLWYPSGYGEQPLYEAEIRIELNNSSSFASSVFAFRKVRIKEIQYSEIQGSFHLYINDMQIFAKGANWIPPDIIPARATDEHYQRLFDIAKMANINYLRFWGGGIYERELFYELCDEYGILLWHDLLYGGEEVPEFDPEFRGECLKEAQEIILRLHNHPSIVVWCGSNETDDFHCKSGSQPPKQRPNGLYFGYRLIHDDFPKMFAQYHPEAIYIPSCPTKGEAAPENAKINSQGFGTTHSNIVHQYSSDAEFDSFGVVPSFMNEVYGVSPDPEVSWRRYLNDEDVDRYNNPVLTDHNIMDLQRNDEWCLFFRHLSFHDVSRRFELPVPEIFSYFTEAHCELIKRYTEFLRRNRRYCGGVAYWMYNSAYTMHGWAFVDYFGVPKAALYAARRAFQPILPIIAVYEDRLDLYNANDTMDSGELCLEYHVCKFNGEILYSSKCTMSNVENQSVLAESINYSEISGLLPEECFVWAKISDSSGMSYYNHRFFVSPCSRKIPNATLEIKLHPTDGNAILLKSSGFISNVKLSPCNENIWPDDNYFDLYPDEEKCVRFPEPLDGRLPDVNWINKSRTPYLVASELKIQDEAIWTVEIYNPSASCQQSVIKVESEHILGQEPKKLELMPFEVKTVAFDLIPIPFGDYPANFNITLHVGDQETISSVQLFEAPELKNGVLKIRNTSVDALLIPAMTFWATKETGDSFYETVQELVLPSNETYQFDFSPPNEIIPFSCNLKTGNKTLVRYWDDRISIKSSHLEQIPLDAFDNKHLSVYPCENCGPDLLNNGNGIRIQFPGSKNEATMFLHYSGCRLFLTIFLKNVPFEQPYINERVYLESCIEAIFSYDDSSVYRDYSFASTQEGDQIFLRRGSKGFSRGRRDHLDGELKIHHFPENSITCYRLILDTNKAEMPKLLTRKRFGFSIRFNWKDNSVSLFGNEMQQKGMPTVGIALLR